MPDSELLKLLSTHGYDAARMAEGKALCDQAQALQFQRQMHAGARYGATDARAAAQKQAHDTYMHDLGVARVALRGERAAAQQLGLSGPRQTTQAGWQHQAQQFYTNALADSVILRALERYKLDQTQLEAGQALVAAVAHGAVAQQITRSAAKDTTRARNAALQALNRWMLDFKDIARLALADQPQRLAELGLASR